MLGRELRAGEREIKRWDGVRLLEKEEGLERRAEGQLLALGQFISCSPLKCQTWN